MAAPALGATASVPAANPRMAAVAASRVEVRASMVTPASAERGSLRSGCEPSAEWRDPDWSSCYSVHADEVVGFVEVGDDGGHGGGDDGAVGADGALDVGGGGSALDGGAVVDEGHADRLA